MIDEWNKYKREFLVLKRLYEIRPDAEITLGDIFPLLNAQNDLLIEMYVPTKSLDNFDQEEFNPEGLDLG